MNQTVRRTGVSGRHALTVDRGSAMRATYTAAGGNSGIACSAETFLLKSMLAVVGRRVLLPGRAAQIPAGGSSALLAGPVEGRVREARLLSDHLEALIGGIRQGRRQQASRRLDGAVLAPDNLPVTGTAAASGGYRGGSVECV
jgi:hypothetical protein